jgi:diadenylate cyclase
MTTEPTTDRESDRVPERDGASGWEGRLREAIARVAPGTPLRQGIDDIIRSHEGAMIVIGHPDELSFLYSGGIRIDQPFTPQLVYELAKMDGAIVVDETLTRIAYANVQLMPDPTIPSAETGTRHRTAERVAKQTGVLVVSISQQRETVTIFVGPARYQLDPTFSVFAKANQALAALETYRRRLDQVLTRLTALEFQGAAVLDDVLVVVQRGEMTVRMVREVERDIVELGSEGRLIKARLDELSAQLPEELAAVVADYHASDAPNDAMNALEQLSMLRHELLLEPETVAETLGYPRGVNPLDAAVSPRGYRALSHVPRLPPAVIRRLVSELDGLEALARASLRELEAVEGVGAVRAKEIKEGLRRLQEHNLVERYLNL